MANSIARSAVREYLEISTRLSGKDLEKGTSIVLVYLRLGMVRMDDVDIERGKKRAIRRICIKDNNVLLADKKGSSLPSSSTKLSTIRVETPAEKLKRLLEP